MLRGLLYDSGGFFMDRQEALDRVLVSLNEAMLDDRHWPVTSALIDDACGMQGNALVVGKGRSQEDGQIFLALDRSNSGIRPAMSPGISVSRVGGAAQVPFIKKISGGVKLALAQYRELAAFSQFASDLDEVTRRQLDHGARVEELMKQMQYAPMTVADMGVVLFAASEGYLVDVPVDRVLDFERDLLGYMNAEHAEWMAEVTASGDHNDEIVEYMKAALDKFQASHSYQ